MSVRRAGILSGCLLALALSVGLGAWYGYRELPRLPGVPEAPVVGVPEGALDHHPAPAYTGPHPRVMERPPEYFPFPITIGEVGPVETLFAGPSTYPFYCGSNAITRRQPLVDNQRGEGVPVFAVDEKGNKTGEIIGYSRDCSHPTDVVYFYRSTRDGKFHPLEEANGDIDQVTVNGRATDFVVRLETGTINRFFYAIAALRGEGESADRPSPSNWNRRLIYQMRGGVGIGRRQGDISKGDIVTRRADQLARGYAVVYSTANQTSNHYNIWLAEDTARRLKKQFIALYGEPLYTVGLGGSGGAIQQYLFAQNAPGLLDAAIPLYSYPDMVSQTIYVFDCEPLEYFFDVVDAANPRWRDAANRTLIQGLSANNEINSRFRLLKKAASLFDGRYRNGTRGATECTQGWRGLVPLVNNPNFVHFIKNFAEEVANRTHWSHWEDLRRFYGAGDDGYANSAWDNEGVQYGLQALVNGKISVDTFLALNATIGGWKSPRDQSNEKLWFVNGGLFPVELSIWSEQNMNLGSLDKPAERTRASREAIEGIYRSGHVFLGDVEIPIIDLRHYLDTDLDMHHSAASFAARERIRRARGHADNQVIWISHKNYTPLNEALDTMDRWMMNIIDNPEAGVAANRPEDASDRCFDKEGNVMAAGTGVWNGAWNRQAVGECMQVYPIYSTPRQVAGAPITGDVFKCALQPVERAIAKGIYGAYTEEIAARIDDMRRIFPSGVCNYNQPDIARPKEELIPGERPVEIAGHLIKPDYRRPIDQLAEEDSKEVEPQPLPVSFPRGEKENP
ncbi:DUF6351 family protein [Microbulbifer thermotolerans]|uniref:DUF6351 family protein n=1 Tax=Microbulbifer thermotolerans TaxID=252514 RepID=UPI00224B88A3|nr:DUF6351 family protein [Microbulbifer thermotolerans]MCX2780437.1 DUF6351 family protein [Microbulbifer thermotolerans]MCX2782485.1 DUF6351 family protein [Microbulbifer thermotolerans]MCX2805891.1 DUF6351 family protein [Microbulbifer thermotolerans]MCX2836201.1 DUF6351 family protein [Microbulbifer thermotolerans]WKT59089.1 DUF6351 family protein [Microbulbifer thermotolerans]